MNSNRNLTKVEIINSVICLALFLVPLLLLVLFPDAKLVDLFLGQGRVFIVWLVFYFFVFLYWYFFERKKVK